jgi:plastocyanin
MKRTLVAALAIVLLLGACSSANGRSTGGAKASSTTTRASASSATGLGNAVTIDAQGFSPRWLIVAVGKKVTFTNTTTTTQKIVFDNAFDPVGKPLQSPSIAPGKTWRWTADSFASFAYHSPQLPGLDGRIQVDPPAEPD